MLKNESCNNSDLKDSDDNSKNEFSNLEKRFYEVRSTIAEIHNIRNNYYGEVALPEEGHSKVLKEINKLY